MGLPTIILYRLLRIKEMPKIIKDIQEWYYPLSINGNTKAYI